MRVHDQCFTSEVLGSLRCDCGLQLNAALELINNSGNGVLVYLRQEGRGIGLKNKIKANLVENHKEINKIITNANFNESIAFGTILFGSKDFFE